jgi:hypothetical protein
MDRRKACLEIAGENGDDLGTQVSGLFQIGGHEDRNPFVSWYGNRTTERNMGTAGRKLCESLFHKPDAFAHGKRLPDVIPG